MYLGEYEIGSTITFNLQSQDGYGQPVDADANPTFELYVNNAPMTPAVTGTMTKINSQTGFYGGEIEATAANGFSAGNTYTIRTTVTIGGIPQLVTDTFQLIANSQTTTAASYTQSTDEENTIPVDADNVFDAALINRSGAAKAAFGKEIIVYPDGVSTRTIKAIIKYNGIASVPGLPHGHAYKIAIKVDNNSTTGLSAAEFDKTKATCKLPKLKGATPSEAKIVDIIKQDAGMVMYEVR